MIVKITVKGAVQGVGYRPFILNKATEYNLKGFVQNIGAAVDILVIGDGDTISSFTDMLKCEYPAGAFIFDVETKYFTKEELLDYLFALNLSSDYLHLGNEDDSDKCKFSIIESSEVDLSREIPVFLPDIGICDDCLKELLDEEDRRFRYPLISCASCGPRISILDKLPYDRDNTAMTDFKMCPKCHKEYGYGRRRHAQTISCYECGPQIRLDDKNSESLGASSTKAFDIAYASSKAFEEAFEEAVGLLQEDKIVGLKGMSGFQLICRPTEKAARRLREIKWREKKPFAIMFSDTNSISEFCYLNDQEKTALESYSRPIVLLNKKKDFPYEVCKDSRYIGAFLPSVGIHRLLCDTLGPLIVTSANRSDEPIISEDSVFYDTFLKDNLVEAVLTHDRRINIPQDDSVVFVTKIAEDNYITSLNRRSRGYVPLPLFVKNVRNTKDRILSFGGDLKSTFSLAYKDRVIISQYLGDLSDMRVNENLRNMIGRFSCMFEFKPSAVVCDMHPKYESVRAALEYSKTHNLPLFQVQHHHAHILSVMAEKSLKSCIGISFDGTGYGTDGNIWGGEILYCRGNEFERAGHLSYVKLCGGDNASKKASLVKECYEYALYDDVMDISPLVKAALSNNINVFNTSSMGRLFDAVSALLQIQSENQFEGECAIALEKAAWEYYEACSDSNINHCASIKFEVKTEKSSDGREVLILDQLSLFEKIKKASESGDFSNKELAFSFHIAIVEAICETCRIISDRTGERKVCLSGGVFGNRLLLSKVVSSLLHEGFEVYVNEFVPAGDAGISLGQAYYLLLMEE